jgi:hypothetical protein
MKFKDKSQIKEMKISNIKKSQNLAANFQTFHLITPYLLYLHLSQFYSKDAA